MAIQIQGGSGLLAEVDGTAYRALRQTNRPIDYGNFGIYFLHQKTGTLAAALAAGSSSAGHLFAFRWTRTDAVAAILALRWRYQSLIAFTAGSANNYGFRAYVVRSYSASHAGGTNLATTGDAFKTRRNMPSSKAADIRIATTAGLTNGTETFDADPFVQSVGWPQRINPNTGTEEQRWDGFDASWAPRIAAGEAPIVLAANEGIVVRNGPRAWPGAGTGIVLFELKWAETPAY